MMLAIIPLFLLTSQYGQDQGMIYKTTVVTLMWSWNAVVEGKT